MWAEARRRGVAVELAELTVNEMTDRELVVAEFVLAIEVGGTQSSLPFVQFLRARDGRIVHVREYFSAATRADLLR